MRPTCLLIKRYVAIEQFLLSKHPFVDKITSVLTIERERRALNVGPDV